ncbi:MAG TPA: hypothetical protein ENH00_13670, partial [Actinobacteria bacterium]|nr:hypothetical protein [Actinomycetota bacterium]
LDVKVGSGAFMKTIEDARLLAETMVGIGASHDTEVVAFLTNMDQPLGNEIGNASEIRESIDVLQGGGPPDLVEITYLLGREMLVLGGVAKTHEAAQDMLSDAVESGRAFEMFRRIVASQGGDVAVVDDPGLLPIAENTHVVRAAADGWVHRCDALDIGVASVRLGGGRETKEADIDPSVGITVHAKVGAAVETGDPLATITYAEPAKLDAALAAMESAWQIGPAAVAEPSILLDEVR